jgi:HEAT repeat protein
MRDATARILDALRSVLGAASHASLTSAGAEPRLVEVPIDPRLVALDDLATLASTLAPGQMSRLITAGLRDTDPRMRCAALGAIAGRAGALRRQPSAAIYQQWSRERPVLHRLTPDVLRALDDEVDDVRLAAVLALYHLAYLPSPARAELDREVLARLADVYAREPSAEVAEEIVRTVASSRGNGDDLKAAVLERGLEDERPGVRAEALRGAAGMQTGRGLAYAAQLLTHPDRRVRLAAARALGDYGRLGLPHVCAVEAALAVEADGKVREALEGVVVWLEQHSA